MTNPKQTPGPANGPRSTRLWPKIAGVFTIAFATLLMLFVAYDLFAALAERSSTTEQTSGEVAPVVIDQNLATELSKVLVLEENPDLSDVKDPFTDRGGLSATVVSNSGSAQPSSSATGSQTAGSSGQSSGSAGQSTGGSTGGAASNTGGAEAPTASPIESTRKRYNEWLDRFGMSGAPLDPRLFAIEDLLPVGIVDGGNGNQEIMFYSEALGKTISFPPGTLFYDGWLTELRPEGVVFSFNDYGRTVRLRSWARSLRNVG